jgi:hypothetical protein
MLETNKLQKLARDIVLRRLPEIKLDRVSTEDFTSSAGEPAVRITLVLTPESVDTISGDDALKLLLDIHDGLAREGEERFPVLEYATADDVPIEED